MICSDFAVFVVICSDFAIFVVICSDFAVFVVTCSDFAVFIVTCSDFAVFIMVSGFPCRFILDCTDLLFYFLDSPRLLVEFYFMIQPVFYSKIILWNDTTDSVIRRSFFYSS